MKVLFVGYELDLDSPVLAWQARVLAHIADRVDFVVAYADRVGRLHACRAETHTLPARPFGLPRRAGGGVLQAAWIASRARGFDVCIVHMAHHWATRLAPFLRPSGVPIVLWYAHGNTSFSLRLAHAGSSAIVTSSREGFRLPSRKLHVIGQGIDTEFFHPVAGKDRDLVVYAGRVAPRKRLHELLNVAGTLARMDEASGLQIVVAGPALTEADRAYQSHLEKRVSAEGLRERVSFLGPLTQPDLVALHARAIAHINLSDTGSMDKTVLEALACGVPVLTSNVAFRDLFAELFPENFVDVGEPGHIAKELLRLRSAGEALDRYRNAVVGRHDLKTYVGRLLAVVEEVVRS